MPRIVRGSDRSIHHHFRRSVAEEVDVRQVRAWRESRAVAVASDGMCGDEVAAVRHIADLGLDDGPDDGGRWDADALNEESPDAIQRLREGSRRNRVSSWREVVTGTGTIEIPEQQQLVPNQSLGAVHETHSKVSPST